MFVKISLLIFLSVIFYSCFPLSVDKVVEVNESEDWLYIGGDLAKTNIAKSKSLLNPPFELMWQFDTDGGLAKNCMSAADAILFVSTLNGEFYAIDITTGKSLGRVGSVGKSCYSTPLVYGNNIILTTSGEKAQNIFSYNIVRGAFQWKKNMFWIESSPVLTGEEVLVSSTNGNLYKLNVNNGMTIWKSKYAEKRRYLASFYTSPTLYDQKIFVGSTDGKMYAINIETGREVWNFKTGAPIYCDAAAYQGKIFFGSDDKNFYCIDTSGNLVWKKSLNTKFLSSSTFSDSMVITAGVNGFVYGLNKNDGNIEWMFRTNGVISATPLLQGENIFVGSFDRNFYCLNAETGKELWKYKCEGRIRTSAVVWKDYIFAAGEPKYIYCFATPDVVEKSLIKKSN